MHGVQECLPGAQQLLASCRAAGMPIVHTMEAHKPDLSDLHPAKLARGNLPPGLRIGDEGELGRILIRGEPGNGIVDEVAPLEVSSCKPMRYCNLLLERYIVRVCVGFGRQGSMPCATLDSAAALDVLQSLCNIIKHNILYRHAR